MLISCMSVKGGPGKSTVVKTLALILMRKGFKVCVIDCDDPQFAVFVFNNNRKKTALSLPDADLSYPDVITLQKEDSYRKVIKEAKKMYDFVLVDSRGDFEQFHFDLITYSDLIICPISPSYDDIEDVGLLVKAVIRENEQREDDDCLAMCFVMNKDKGSSQTAAIINDVQEITDMPILNTYIPMTDSISAGSKLGLSVIDIDADYSTFNRFIRESGKKITGKKYVANAAVRFSDLAHEILCFIEKNR